MISKKIGTDDDEIERIRARVAFWDSEAGFAALAVGTAGANDVIKDWEEHY